MIKKYFIFLPLMASCNGLGVSNNMMEPQRQIQSDDLVGVPEITY